MMKLQKFEYLSWQYFNGQDEERFAIDKNKILESKIDDFYLLLWFAFCNTVFLRDDTLLLPGKLIIHCNC